MLKNDVFVRWLWIQTGEGATVIRFENSPELSCDCCSLSDLCDMGVHKPTGLSRRNDQEHLRLAGSSSASLWSVIVLGFRNHSPNISRRRELRVVGRRHTSAASCVLLHNISAGIPAGQYSCKISVCVTYRAHAVRLNSPHTYAHWSKISTSSFPQKLRLGSASPPALAFPP